MKRILALLLFIHLGTFGMHDGFFSSPASVFQQSELRYEQLAQGAQIIQEEPDIEGQEEEAGIYWPHAAILGTLMLLRTYLLWDYYEIPVFLS